MGPVGPPTILGSVSDNDPPPRAELIESEPGAVERTDQPFDSDGALRRRAQDQPPVVARLVVEIRSDGSRTIARGAIEDVATGQKVAVEAKGSSPLSLAMAMARSMFRAPALARTAARALLPGRSKKPKR